MLAKERKKVKKETEWQSEAMMERETRRKREIGKEKGRMCRGRWTGSSKMLEKEKLKEMEGCR